MPVADLSGTQIYYEVSGPEAGLPLLLIHGLGAQLVMWAPGLISQLEQAGFRVIQFDNRDVGLSATVAGDYELSDMAADARDLVNHLGLGRVHVVGQSMGGMIAQIVSISHPEVVFSLTSVYSAPSLRYLVTDSDVREQRGLRPAASYEEAVEQFIAREKISGLDGLDDVAIQAYAEKVVSRDYKREASHHGRTAHMRATMSAPDRMEALRHLAIPAAVIHGRGDPLISFEGGIATASAIPGAELHIFAGMKHQLRADLWPDYVRIIQRTAQRAHV